MAPGLVTFTESWPRHIFSKIILAGLFKAKFVVRETCACRFTRGTQRFVSLVRNGPSSWSNSFPMGSLKLASRLGSQSLFGHVNLLDLFRIGTLYVKLINKFPRFPLKHRLHGTMFAC